MENLLHLVELSQILNCFPLLLKPFPYKIILHHYAVLKIGSDIHVQ